MDTLNFKVNDKDYNIPSFSNQLDQNLLAFLREEGFTGCKQVCGEGGCGACTVIVSRWDDKKEIINHQSITACLMPLPTLHNTQITTIEGLSLLNHGQLHPVCDAFYQLGASQCGFCTPGFILSFFARLANDPPPLKEELENIFDGNLCRCTGYRPILDAASVFCKDPLEKEEYLTDTQHWRQQFENCQSLSSLFPDSFKCPHKAQLFKGIETSWAQPTEVDKVLELKNTNLGEPIETNNNGVRLIGGNTDIGYQEQQHPTHLKKRIYLNQVDRLKKIQWTSSGVEIGAGISISELYQEIKQLKETTKDELPSSITAVMDQCRFFANNNIRNMATIGGGLANFSSYSDLIPLWVATKSEVIFVKDGVEQRLSLCDLYSDKSELEFDPSSIDLLLAIFLPFSKKNELIYSYKYARRRMDSITFLSACMYVNVDEDNKNIQESVFCFDGLGVPGFRAQKTEKYVRSSVWNGDLLNKSLEVLKTEITDSNKSPLPSRLKNYQLRLASGILVRFYSQFRKEFFKEVHLLDEPLYQRYPKVAHRSHVQFEENAVGVLGKSIPHRNAKNQTDGKAKYTIDHEVKNCLYAAVVGAPVASGKIISIDASQALKHSGVVGFYSAKDIPGENRFGFRVEDEEFLASENVGYVGQPVGVLVAKTDAIAKECAPWVKVEVEESKPLLTFEAAIQAKSFHGRPQGYLVKQGDLEEGFQNSHEIVSGEIEVTGQSHFYLEPQSSLVEPKDSGFMVYSSTQSPSNVIGHISKILSIANNKVNVEVGRLGGGFGGKQLRAGPIAAICALAAAKQKQPVKLTLQRHEDMAYCPGRSPLKAKYKAGFSNDGKIKAIDIQFYLNGGYTNDYSADITETATLLMDSCYYIENVQVHGTCLKMNHGSYTSTRGFGKPQASAIIESILDHGASQLNIDPTNVRSVNLYQKGDRTITKTLIKDDVISKCWHHLLKKSDYDKIRKEVDEFNQNNKWLKRGLATVSSKGNMGFIESDDINRGIAIVQIRVDGTVSVNHSGCEMGQGINTRMAQVAAHNLGVPLESVEVTDTQSALISNTPPTTMVATDLIGRAIINACHTLKDSMQKFSGSFQERVTQAYDQGVSLSAKGIHTSPRLVYDYEKQEGDISYFFVWGAALSVAEVDLISGSFRLLKTNVVQDCGKSLNPHLDVGQAEGGFMFGVGYYTMEEPIYSEKGKLITDNVSGYKVPSCGDVPLDWDIELFNYAPSDEGLHSSKGIGEANTQLGLSAYFAIKDAVKAARRDNQLSPVFSLGFPASVDRVGFCLPKISDLIK